jgi:hypothetical protein
MQGTADEIGDQPTEDQPDMKTDRECPEEHPQIEV